MTENAVRKMLKCEGQLGCVNYSQFDIKTSM